MFAFGALCGLITGIMSMTLCAAIHVHEVEKENEYLKKQLHEQSETMKDNEYKYFDVNMKEV